MSDLKKRLKIFIDAADDAVIVPISDEQYHQNMRYYNECVEVMLRTLKQAGISENEENIWYSISDMTDRTNMDKCGKGWKDMLGINIRTHYACAICRAVKDSRQAGSDVWGREKIENAVKLCGIEEQLAYAFIYVPLGIDVPISEELQKTLDQIAELIASVNESRAIAQA